MKTMSDFKLSKKKIIILTIVIAIMSVSGVLALTWLSNKPARYPWLFKGAYADYQGGTYPFGYIMHLEVLDFNDTHVQLYIHCTQMTKYGAGEKNATEWFKFEEIHKAPLTIFSGKNLSKIYQEQVSIAGLGRRNCTVYEYTSNKVIKCYIDQQTGWLIRIIYTEYLLGQYKLSHNIVLTETNIPQLKK